MKRDFLWLWLFSTKGIGRKTLHKLRPLIQNITEQELISTLQNSNIRGIKKVIQHLSSSKEEAKKLYLILKKKDIYIIHPDEEFYPRRLYRLLKEEAPPLIFSKGNIQLLNHPSIAIIGSRNAGPKALEMARKISSNLARMKLNIVSGYAKGVDFTAHIKALNSGGTTTIVLPEGILSFRPKKEILKNLSKILVLSEFPPSAPWKAFFAMERNKTICGLSQAVIVVAAKEKGGTMHAAFFAMEHGIPLFVVSPDKIDRPIEGNNILIKKGAHVVDPESLPETFWNNDYINSTQPSLFE